MDYPCACQRGELNYPGAAVPDRAKLYLSGGRSVPLQRGEPIEQIESREGARTDTLAHFVRDSVDKRADGLIKEQSPHPRCWRKSV